MNEGDEKGAPGGRKSIATSRRRDEQARVGRKLGACGRGDTQEENGQCWCEKPHRPSPGAEKQAKKLGRRAGSTRSHWSFRMSSLAKGWKKDKRLMAVKAISKLL